MAFVIRILKLEMEERKALRIKVISMGAAEAGKPIVLIKRSDKVPGTGACTGLETTPLFVSRLLLYPEFYLWQNCLIKRYCEKRFVSKYMATLGIDFGVSKVKSNEQDIKVNIFDMAGQPFFAEVRNEFYKDTQGVILVYDVTNRSSFEAMSDCLIEMRNSLSQPSDMDSIVFVVCANKVDIVGKHTIDTSEGKLWAEIKGFHYFETSALNGENVQEMFECLIHTVVSVLVRGVKPGVASLERGYSIEQASLVTRIRSCHDNYKMLGVSQTSSRDEIHRAYKHLAVLLHPDKNLAPGSDEAFKSVAKAREDLIKNR